MMTRSLSIKSFYRKEMRSDHFPDSGLTREIEFPHVTHADRKRQVGRRFTNPTGRSRQSVLRTWIYPELGRKPAREHVASPAGNIRRNLQRGELEDLQDLLRTWELQKHGRSSILDALESGSGLLWETSEKLCVLVKRRSERVGKSGKSGEIDLQLLQVLVSMGKSAMTRARMALTWTEPL
jgi:hypothetical protein